ncbi:hypothetical protein [Microcoleus sp. AT3-D2]|uniref:hypothetical protein n=1 Tax=Microcoleus sp. AT3-D2 TaxID=2818612 RepID=UPI002FD636E3
MSRQSRGTQYGRLGIQVLGSESEAEPLDIGSLAEQGNHLRAVQVPDSRFPIPNSQFPIPNSQFPIPNSSRVYQTEFAI